MALKINSVREISINVTANMRVSRKIRNVDVNVSNVIISQFEP